MGKNIFKLTNTDFRAIDDDEFNYLSNKGANLYINEDYSKSIEYYRIAACMGDVQAICNLGYSYLYGRGVDINYSLAMAYFNIAAKKGDIDAAYKLGYIYSVEDYGVIDPELSVYYYNIAIRNLFKVNENYNFSIPYARELDDYPSLCFAYAKELLPDGNMYTDINVSYQFLLHAEIGYKREISNGANMYKENYDKVLELINDSIYDDVRNQNNTLFDEIYGD